MLTCTTSFRRRTEPIDLDQGTSIPLGFIFQLAHKLTPSNIGDRFCKAVVLNHVLDRQTLHANHLVFVNNASRELVLISFDVFFPSGQNFSTERSMMPLCNLFHLLQM